LTLERIDWESPAALLEKLIAYERARIQSWTDLKNRLDSDRRCYAFLPSRMPGEPSSSSKWHSSRAWPTTSRSCSTRAPRTLTPDRRRRHLLLDPNTQTGLRGISFATSLDQTRGRQLSHTAALNLRHSVPDSRFPRLARPPPGEATARCSRRQKKSDPQAVLSDPAGPGRGHRRALAPTLRASAPTTSAGEEQRQAVRSGRRFHLATAPHRAPELARHSSPKGLQESAGLMVNYLYRLADIEGHHEAYVAEGRSPPRRREGAAQA